MKNIETLARAGFIFEQARALLKRELKTKGSDFIDLLAKKHAILTVNQLISEFTDKNATDYVKERHNFYVEVLSELENLF